MGSYTLSVKNTDGTYSDINSGFGLPVQSVAGSSLIGFIKEQGTSTTDVTSAALTTTTTTSTIIPTSSCGSYEILVPVTVVTGTTPTLDIVVQESDDGGTNWFDVYHFERITATGSYRSPVIPLTGNRIRYVQTVSGTTPSFTRSIVRNEQSMVLSSLRRRFINRTLDPNTLNNATGWFNIEGTDTLDLIVNLSVFGSGSPTISIDLADDAAGTFTWTHATTLSGWAALGLKSTGPVQIGSPKFARIRTSTAGTGCTLNYVRIGAWKS